MAETLREYLIGLGFAVDESGWRKFNSATARSAQQVLTLGAEAAATGLAIAAMVERIARHYEELYYISQRTEASVSNIKAYGLAARQVGLSVEQMTQAQESFSAAQRMNPGVVGLVKQFTSATDKADQLVDTIDGLKTRFGEQGYFAAARVASILGLDEPTFRMLWMNLERFKKARAEQKSMMAEAGIDADKAAKDFVEFTRELNTFFERISIAGQRIATDFLPYVSAAVRELNALVKAFNEFNKESEGRAGMVGAVVTGGLGAWMAKRMLGRLFGWAAGSGASAAAGAGGAAAAGGAAGAGTAGGAGGAAATTAAAKAAGSSVAGIMMRYLGGPLGILLGSTKEANAGEQNLYRWDERTQRYEPTDELKRQQGAGDAPVEKRKEEVDVKRREEVVDVKRKEEVDIGIGNVTGMNADLVDRLRKLRAEMPPDLGGFRIKSGKRTPEEQALLYANRRRNPYPVAEPGFSSHEQGEAADLKFETPAGDQWFRAQMNKYGIASPVRGDPVHFERAERRAARPHPFLGAELTPGAEGQGPVYNFTQRTDINVGEGPNAIGTAQAVLDGQSRVNGDAVRNFGAKVR